jgi:hypothetical protein
MCPVDTVMRHISTPNLKILSDLVTKPLCRKVNKTEVLVRDSIRRWKEDKTETNAQNSGLSRPKVHHCNDD